MNQAAITVTSPHPIAATLGILFYRLDVAGDQANFGMSQFGALIGAVENFIER